MLLVSFEISLVFEPHLFSKEEKTGPVQAHFSVLE